MSNAIIGYKTYGKKRSPSVNPIPLPKFLANEFEIIAIIIKHPIAERKSTPSSINMAKTAAFPHPPAVARPVIPAPIKTIKVINMNT